MFTPKGMLLHGGRKPVAFPIEGGAIQRKEVSERCREMRNKQDVERRRRPKTNQNEKLSSQNSMSIKGIKGIDSGTPT